VTQIFSDFSSFIFQGILIGLANLDGVVKVIRSAKDSTEASEGLQKG